MIPQDPNMLLSYVNMKLRNCYPSLEALCDDLDLDEQEIRAKLSENGWEYDPSRNCFC